MIPAQSLLVSLVQRIDQIPEPIQAPQKRGRGRQKTSTDKLFLKALVIMIVRHLHKVGERLSVLEQPTAEMQQLRALLCQNEPFPSGFRWQRT